MVSRVFPTAPRWPCSKLLCRIEADRGESPAGHRPQAPPQSEPLEHHEELPWEGSLQDTHACEGGGRRGVGGGAEGGGGPGGGEEGGGGSGGREGREEGGVERGGRGPRGVGRGGRMGPGGGGSMEEEEERRGSMRSGERRGFMRRGGRYQSQEFIFVSCLCLQVNFNEPLSMLQRMLEELLYAKPLLEQAAACATTLEELTYVSAYAVSNYAHATLRVGKPFNPMLGETYECDRRAELGWRCFLEQVRGLRVVVYGKGGRDTLRQACTYVRTHTHQGIFRGGGGGGGGGGIFATLLEKCSGATL